MKKSPTDVLSVEDDITAVPPRINAAQGILSRRVMYGHHPYIRPRPIQNRCMCRFPPSRLSVTCPLYLLVLEYGSVSILRCCFR